MQNSRQMLEFWIILYYARRKYLYCPLYLNISHLHYKLLHCHKILFIEIYGNVQFHFTVICAGEIL